MDEELPKYLTVDDAVALLVNFPSIKAGSCTLEDMLNGTFTAATNPSHVVFHGDRRQYALAIKKAIDEELDGIRGGKNSDLEIIDSYGAEKIDSGSLCYWASVHLFIEVPGARPPMLWRKSNSRIHQSNYLTILDNVIETFWEEGGSEFVEGRPPKKAAVVNWIKEKYGPDFSGVVAKNMFTIANNE